MKVVSTEDKLFFFERNWYTLDGLWFICAEVKVGWETALKIDVAMWIQLLTTVIRRIKRYLKIETNTINDIIKILTFRWSIEGWDYKLLKYNESEQHIGIITCPYKEMMDRNPDRRNRIKLICKNMCLPFYKKVIEDFNPDITFEVDKSQGFGADMCNFKFIAKNSKLIEEDELIKRKISLDDKLFYFERNIMSMDGWWMIETEKELGYDLALKIDIDVWQRLYKIIFRRVKKYLNLEGNTLEDLVEILRFTWSCEGYNYEIVKENHDTIIHFTTCPYITAMERNPERHDKIVSICKDMCIPFYEPAIKEFNPNIMLLRNKFLGAGDNFCDYHFKLK